MNQPNELHHQMKQEQGKACLKLFDIDDRILTYYYHSIKLLGNV